jgi:hypothetical protein
MYLIKVKEQENNSKVNSPKNRKHQLRNFPFTLQLLKVIPSDACFFSPVHFPCTLFKSDFENSLKNFILLTTSETGGKTGTKSQNSERVQ